jgi:hypothetical protein
MGTEQSPPTEQSFPTTFEEARWTRAGRAVTAASVTAAAPGNRVQDRVERMAYHRRHPCTVA